MTDAKQADFRLLPPPLQRCFAPLIEAVMEALHAKFVLLKRVVMYATDEAVAIRWRAEAIVAFSGMGVWVAAAASGQQCLATWLADMA